MDEIMMLIDQTTSAELQERLVDLKLFWMNSGKQDRQLGETCTK